MIAYKDSAPRSRWRHRRQTMELYGCGVPLTGTALGSDLGPPLRGGLMGRFDLAERRFYPPVRILY